MAHNTRSVRMRKNERVCRGRYIFKTITVCLNLNKGEEKHASKILPFYPKLKMSGFTRSYIEILQGLARSRDGVSKTILSVTAAVVEFSPNSDNEMFQQ